MKTFLFVITLITSFYVHADPIAVGFYSDGQLVDGESMAETGEGYIQMYREDDQIWATRQILNLIQATAVDMAKKYPGRDRMQVEAMSLKNGGEVGGHGSHENGLDVDIQYFKLNNVEHDPIATGRKYADSMVIGKKASPNFDVERNWELVKTLHKHGKVQRIFMDQVLKKQICIYVKAKKDLKTNIEALRSIRHVENHHDHMHVRLRCPPEMKKCVAQQDPPAGSGCP